MEEIPPLFFETPYYLAPGKRPARADVIDLMALLKSVEKKQDKPKRAKGAQRKERPA